MQEKYLERMKEVRLCRNESCEQNNDIITYQHEDGLDGGLGDAKRWKGT